MDPDRPNKRREYRYPARFRVEARQGRRRLDSRVLRDISSSGLGISSGEAVPQGRVVEVRFPDVDPKFVARGQVIWCHRSDGRGFDIGVRFTEAAAESYENLCTRVREIETYRRTVEDLRGETLDPDDAARQWRTRFGSSVP